ncbi:MAG TPA: hypothetical protein VKR31_11390 [Rhizomicrobium sp.]|nr:hypothetical protein [Rhizomicrobium sp.]
MKYSVALLAAAAVCAIGSAAAGASTSRETSGQKMPTPLHLSHAPAVGGASAIAGTWLASYDGGVHVGYIQWQKGGTLWQMIDFAPKTGNLLMGDWSTDGRGTYTLTAAGWTYDTRGNNRNGYFTKTESETLSGDSYSGTFEVTYYDLGGNITFQHDGTASATRIESQ